MKRFYTYFVLFFVGTLGMLTSCVEELDLSNIDTRSEVKVGLASPLGAIRVAISDVMLTPGINNFVIDPDGVVTYRDTSRLTMKFQDFNWGENYASSTHKDFDMPNRDVLKALSGFPLQEDVHQTLLFDFALELKKLNTNPEKERFDSLLLDTLFLTSQLSKENMNLDWGWIDSIVIDLGQQCYREAGSKYLVYKKTRDVSKNYNFNKPLDSNIDNFSICLMKDRSLTPGKNTLEEFNSNVVDQVPMQLYIYLTIPQGTTLDIRDNATIAYYLDFKGLKHKAIWGYITLDNSMAVKDSIHLTDGWDIGEMLRDMRLPFARPEINFNITTQLAANWEMSSDMLYTTNAKGEKGSANFDKEHPWKKEFLNKIDFDPSTIGQSATYSFKFNNTDSLGNIDNLFTVSPEYLVYQFGFMFMDPQKYPQVRIPSNANIDIEMQVELPLEFNQGLYISYRDTLPNLDFSSLVSDAIEMKEACLYLKLDAYNEMPIDLTGILYCLDKNKQKLDIFGDSITFTAQDSSKKTVEIHEDKFDILSATKEIVLEFIATDESLKGKSEIYPISINKEQVLQLQLGFAGNADAVLNFNNK